MGLDIRFPIGLLFTVVGLMITIYGVATLHSPIYERSLGIDVNLFWGITMLIFGAIMLALGWKRSASAPAASAGNDGGGARRGH